MMNIEQILQYLPHRYPFLLVNRVLEMEVGKRILALKNVTINEPFFPGHFPHAPVMPGVLILEALAQAAAVLSFETMGTRPDADSIVYFAGIDEARFRRPVVPGISCCWKWSCCATCAASRSIPPRPASVKRWRPRRSSCARSKG